MFSKSNVLQEKRRAEMRAFSVNENIHPIWGEDFFFCSLPTFLGQVISIIITQCTIVKQKSHNVRYFYKKRATKKRERIWN